MQTIPLYSPLRQSDEFHDAFSRDDSLGTESSDACYTDARSASKTSAVSVSDGMWRQKAKNMLCYSFAVTLASLFLFTSFCAIYHDNAYSSYDPTAWVIDYSTPTPSSSLAASPSSSGTLLSSLAAQGFGTAEKPIVVSLAGDSLISDACQNRDLPGKMLSRLQTHTSLQFKIAVHGQPGATIASLMQNDSVPLWIREDSSNVVLVMANSDVSNSDPHWPADVWTSYQVSYQTALSDLTSYMTEQLGGTTRWALAGPSVLTEGPLFKPARLSGFADMLQDIRSINKAHLQSQRATWMDFYGGIKSISVDWWPIYSLYATEDGEHLSELGVNIQADNFVQFLIN